MKEQFDPISIDAYLDEIVIQSEEAETVGDLLVALHNTEAVMAHTLAWWFRPNEPNRIGDLSDMLLYTPYRIKIEYLLQLKLINKKMAGQLQDIYNKRNILAHPRPKGERASKAVSHTKRDQIKKILLAATMMLLESSGNKTFKACDLYGEKGYRRHDV